ncbi:MAG: hypothetical protein WCJ18_08525, partial [Planctomycetota bacterium]
MRSLSGLPRRRFLTGAAAAAGASVLPGLPGLLRSEEPAPKTPETLAQVLHASLSPQQREAVCFPWEYVHPKFGLLRTRVANNWNASEPTVAGDFFTKDQQHLVREIFEHLIEPEWHARIDKQLEDDAG